MFQKTEQEIWKEIEIHAFESLENLENQKDSTWCRRETKGGLKNAAVTEIQVTTEGKNERRG